MGEWQLSPIEAIVGHQQPASQACFILAPAIGQRGLRGLN